jgi:hypothetical protein
MTVTTHQPIFLPWPGFFYKMLHADTMVLLDRVQFPLGRSWMTRNRVKSDKGELWLRVPVRRSRRGVQIIGDVETCDDTNWRGKHLRSLRDQYANAPYRDEHLPAVGAVYARGHRRLVDFNLDLIRYLRDAMGLECRLTLQSDVGGAAGGTDLIVSICRRLGADRYVNLPIVAKHLEAGRFRAGGIEPVFVRFDPPVYPQLWGDFRYNLSTLDLLLNCGPGAMDIIGRSAPSAS